MVFCTSRCSEYSSCSSPTIEHSSRGKELLNAIVRRVAAPAGAISEGEQAISTISASVQDMMRDAKRSHESSTPKKCGRLKRTISSSIATVSYWIALIWLLAVQAWIIWVGWERILSGEGVPLAPFVYILFSIPSIVFFLVSQYMHFIRWQDLTYGLLYFSMLGVFFMLQPYY